MDTSKDYHMPKLEVILGSTLQLRGSGCVRKNWHGILKEIILNVRPPFAKLAKSVPAIKFFSIYLEYMHILSSISVYYTYYSVNSCIVGGKDKKEKSVFNTDKVFF